MSGTDGGVSLKVKSCMFAWVAVRRQESVISKSNFGISDFTRIGFSLVTEVLTAEFFPGGSNIASPSYSDSRPRKGRSVINQTGRN